MTIVADWRSLSLDEIAPLYESERRRWLDNLHWDYSDTLADMERARLSGLLPGFVLRDDGGICGWSYFLIHQDELQIGGMVTRTAEATDTLLQSILGSSAAAGARSRMAFGYFDAPGLDELLRRADLIVERYSYQALSLALLPSLRAVSPGVIPYDFARASEVADLLGAAYSVASLRPFARRGTRDEWHAYVSQLTHTAGCGAFDPEVSRLLVSVRGHVSGVAIVNRISDDTAHLSQIAIDPAAQGRRQGAALLREACLRAKQNGSARMTLMVGSSNAAACRLYQRFGFTETASFLLAA